MKQNSRLDRERSIIDNQLKKLATFSHLEKDTSLSVLMNSNLEHDTYLQKIIKHITMEKGMEINYWGELASVICCDRSDIYLRSLLNKIYLSRLSNIENKEDYLVEWQRLRSQLG